ncbi:hypothetical protein NMY22_g9120 [Coprinellus aureogranulatus]|nr:hypothetical protein NMY22_g9120 [Coprinellus aureogranulatus]
MTPRAAPSGATHGTAISQHLIKTIDFDVQGVATGKTPLEDIDRNEEPIFGELKSTYGADRPLFVPTHPQAYGHWVGPIPAQGITISRPSSLQESQANVCAEHVDRLPNRTVVPKYEPIHALTGDWDEFMGAFAAIFSCHAMLWSIDICHRDIRPNNMKWDPVWRHAKLCDFDLCHFPDNCELSAEEQMVAQQNYSNTGTWIFMGSELLTSYAMKYGEKRVYRHEVESFIAVLLWFTCQYEDGKLLKPAPLREWLQRHYVFILSNREHTYQNIMHRTFTRPSSLDKELWSRIAMTVIDLIGFLASFGSARSRHYLYSRALRYDRPEADDIQAIESLDGYNGLRSLLKILTPWGITRLPRVKHFAVPLKRYINARELHLGPIRLFLSEEEEECADMPANRVPYLVTMPQFEAISVLTKNWDDFMGAFVTLFCAHAMIWSIDICHRDIRPNNMMWDPVARQAKLCDFDLCHPPDTRELSAEEQSVAHRSYSNTGTWIFMADELLTHSAMRGKVKRVYRHEVESFIAVLIWFTWQYEGGKLLQPAPLREWVRRSYVYILSNREHTYWEIKHMESTRPSFLDEELWFRITLTVIKLSSFLGSVKAVHCDHCFYAATLHYKPSAAAAVQPRVSVDGYDGLRSLFKILTWPIFGHTRAAPFTKLLEGYIDARELHFGPIRLFCPEEEEEFADTPANRVPYLVVMPRLEAISALTKNWDDFMGAFVTLFCGHAMLWSTGIRCEGISEDNLLWDPIAKKPKLCDFDLSHFAEPPSISEDETQVGPTDYLNTGNWIFKAKELLTPRGMEGQVKRVYRHEVEAFVAVLLWVSCQYKDGKRQIPAPLDDWDQTLYECTVSQRDKTYTEIEWGTFTRPSALDAKQWRRIVRTITKFRVFLAAHALTRSEQFDYQQALDDDDDEADSLKPDTPVYEFDTLRSLPKIFTWPIFKHPRAKHFVGLTKECIGLTGGNSAPTSA